MVSEIKEWEHVTLCWVWEYKDVSFGVRHAFFLACLSCVGLDLECLTGRD